MIDEGVIKFRCNWTNKPHGIGVPQVLMDWRDRMHALRLIGVYQDINIGYGNISVKCPEGMLISGTQTGHLETLGASEYSLVTDYDIEHNSLDCIGQVKASAESLTHLALYKADSKIKAIIHIHNLEMWERLLHKIPTSDESVPYGTPEMASEIQRLFIESGLPETKLMAMGGHKEGLIAFGATMRQAGEVILSYPN